jgi:hypothetical protein
MYKKQWINLSRDPVSLRLTDGILEYVLQVSYNQAKHTNLMTKVTRQ